MRLDLPTLERPANAISGLSVSGRKSRLGTLRTKCQGLANSASPAASSSGVNSSGVGALGLEPTAPGLRVGFAAEDLARLVDARGVREVRAVETVAVRFAVAQGHADLEVGRIRFQAQHLQRL